MALPAFLGVLAAHQALGEVTGTLLKPLHSIINAEMAPKDVYNHYNAFCKRPIVIPEPGDLINLLNRELITFTRAQDFLSAHGINFSRRRGTVHDRNTAEAWLAVARLHQHVPDVP